MFVYGPYKVFGVTNVWIDVIESDEWPVILQRSPKHHKNSVSNEEREEASVSFPLALCLCQSVLVFDSVPFDLIVLYRRWHGEKCVNS